MYFDAVAFSINHVNKYVIDITRFDRLEDVGDDFVTVEELKELLGAGPHQGYVGNGLHIRMDLIKEKLLELIQLAKNDNKKSIIIDDDELVQVLQGKIDGQICAYSVGEIVDNEGLRRVGNRLFIREDIANSKKLNELHREQYTWLIAHGIRSFNEKNKFVITLKSDHLDRCGAIEFLKKFMTFDEIEFNMKDENIDLKREMWDNPEKFFKKK